MAAAGRMPLAPRTDRWFHAFCVSALAAEYAHRSELNFGHAIPGRADVTSSSDRSAEGGAEQRALRHVDAFGP